MTMALPTLKCARAVRDGGIDAMAALNAALASALVDLTPADQTELKRIFGQVMGGIVLDIINPTWKAYPELEPDDLTWSGRSPSTSDGSL